MGKVKVAIVYDFDGTLAQGNIQENSFIPEALGMDKDGFWAEVKEEAKKNDMDEVLSYMQLLITEAKKKNQENQITKTSLMKHGGTVKYFEGVETFFDRINQYAKEQGVDLEHYIVSSGTKEMIEGTSISKNFKRIYASSFKYGESGIPEWPALAISYTTKTQFLFRINKGIKNAWDNTQINEYMPVTERKVPFENMIYIGDGSTDIPAMKLVKSKGGTSISVYTPEQYDEKNFTRNKQTSENRLYEQRVNYIAEANYEDGSDLDKIIKSTIAIISVKSKIMDHGPNLVKDHQRKIKPVEAKNTDSDSNQEEIDERLNILGIEGFIVKPDFFDFDRVLRRQNKNYSKKIVLVANRGWNDYGYTTDFYLCHSSEYIAEIKIAFPRQEKHFHTVDDDDFTSKGDHGIPVMEFKKLNGKFLSRIFLDDTCEYLQENKEEKIEALKFLLNDISDKKEEYLDGGVIEISLFR